MSAVNGTADTPDILKRPWDAAAVAANLLQSLLERQQQGKLTISQEISLAAALSEFSEAQRWINTG
jgi:hypothetical protein